MVIGRPRIYENVRERQKAWNKTANGRAALLRGFYRYREKERQLLLDLLGGICVKCGFSDKRALQFDHIAGGGTRDCKTLGNTTLLVHHYLKHPEIAKATLQVLCANCNWIKRNEMKECRRK